MTDTYSRLFVVDVVDNTCNLILWFCDVSFLVSNFLSLHTCHLDYHKRSHWLRSIQRVWSVIFITQQFRRHVKRRTQKWDVSRGWNFGREKGLQNGDIRSILKCLLPCIRQRSRSPSQESSRSIKENKTLENCKKTTQGQTSPQYEALIQAERRQELDIWEMTCEEETS